MIPTIAVFFVTRIVLCNHSHYLAFYDFYDFWCLSTFPATRRSPACTLDSVLDSWYLRFLLARAILLFRLACSLGLSRVISCTCSLITGCSHRISLYKHAFCPSQLWQPSMIRVRYHGKRAYPSSSCKIPSIRAWILVAGTYIDVSGCFGSFFRAERFVPASTSCSRQLWSGIAHVSHLGACSTYNSLSDSL